MADVNKDTIKFFEQAAKGFADIERMSGTVIVEDSQYVESTQRNIVGPPKLAATDAEARRKGRLRAAMTKQDFDETDTPPEELSKANEELVEDFIIKLVDDAFGI